MWCRSNIFFALLTFLSQSNWLETDRTGETKSVKSWQFFGDMKKEDKCENVLRSVLVRWCMCVQWLVFCRHHQYVLCVNDIAINALVCVSHIINVYLVFICSWIFQGMSSTCMWLVAGVLRSVCDWLQVFSEVFVTGCRCFRECLPMTHCLSVKSCSRL